MTPVSIFEWCRPWGFERAKSAERLARKSATHGSASGPNPAAEAAPFPNEIRSLGVPRNKRPEGQSHGGAAPLPDELRSLGYPATNSPRGKAQAGKSPLQSQ